MDTKLTFNAYGYTTECYVDFRQFADNKLPCLYLMTTEHEPYGVANLNFDLPLPYVAIDVNNMPYIVDILIKGGYLKPGIVKHIRSGYVQYPVYELTDEAIARFKKSVEE